MTRTASQPCRVGRCKSRRLAAFQRAILGVICLNTITMAMNSTARATSLRLPGWFSSFTVIFIAEFALKHSRWPGGTENPRTPSTVGIPAF